MKKIYCVFCGEENSPRKKSCSKCGKDLNPKEHLWRDYFLNHVKDDLKGKTTDKLSSLVISYIKSNLYGIVFSATLITSTILGVSWVIDNNPSYITKTDKNPMDSVEVSSLDLESELVKKLYSYNKINYDRFLDKSFYENQLIRYDDFDDSQRIMMAAIYNLKGIVQSEKMQVSSCDDIKDYKEVYDFCVGYPEWVIEAADNNVVELSVLESAYKELFGSDKKMPRIGFNLYYSRQCSYSKKRNNYLCTNLPAGFNSGTYEETKLAKAIKINKSIILYDYYVFYSMSDPGFGVYKDNKLEVKLSDKWDESILEKGQIYMHIYKQDKDGNYYWYSSEAVSKIYEAKVEKY